MLRGNENPLEDEELHLVYERSRLKNEIDCLLLPVPEQHTTAVNNSDETECKGMFQHDPNSQKNACGQIKIITKKHYSGNAKGHSQSYLCSMIHLERSVKEFKIILDESDRYTYESGSRITGNLKLTTERPINIQNIEFSVLGRGVVCYKNPYKGSTLLKKQAYLHKRSRLIGNKSSDQRIALDSPGIYDFRFSYQLPKSLPSSIYYIDPRGTLNLEINYSLHAWISQAANRENSKTQKNVENKSKNIIQTHKIFIVCRPFNIDTTLSSSLSREINREITTNFCCLFQTAILDVSATTDQCIYRCGDGVTVSVKTKPHTSAKIHCIRVGIILSARVTNTKEIIRGVISSKIIKDIQWTLARNETDDPVAIYRLRLFTPTDMLPTFIFGSSLLTIQHCIDVTIHLKQSRRRFHLEVPVYFGTSELIRYPWQRESKMMPSFNVSTRFPNYSWTHNISTASTISNVSIDSINSMIVRKANK